MASASRIIPANIPEKLTKEIEETSKKAFKVLGASGVVRIDYLYDKKSKKYYVNELNTIPGSLAFYLWDAKGVKFTDLLDEMISIGIKDYKKRISAPDAQRQCLKGSKDPQLRRKNGWL